MELWKLENRKQIAFGMAIVFMLLLFTTIPSAKANNDWKTDSADGYTNIGNGIEVRLDFVNGAKESINNSNNLFYNGQKMYVQLEWRSLNEVTSGTSLEVNLPQNSNSAQINFESPLLKSELISDEQTKTELKRDGRTISTYFSATTEKPIVQNTEKTIIIPHNIFVTPDPSKFAKQDIQVEIVLNDGTKKILTKSITKIAEGLKLEDITINTPDSSSDNLTPVDSFDKTKDNLVLLNFNYSNGKYGIKDGDVLLLKFSDYGDLNNVAKLHPHLFEDITIYGTIDKVIKEVGNITFVNQNDTDTNTYARITFNNAFDGYFQVSGYVRFLTNISFEKSIDGESIINLVVNGDTTKFPVTGPTDNRTYLVSKEGVPINNDNMIRWSIVLNQEDLDKEDLGKDDPNKKPGYYPVVNDVAVVDSIADDNQYIDESSIRIVKVLSSNYGKGYKAFGLDENTLKPETNTLLSVEPSLWSANSGLTVKEFEQYSNTSNIITYIKDKDTEKVKGFTLKLGNLNEEKGTLGQYSSVKGNSSKETFNKNNKPFGYMVYYNTVLTGKTGAVTVHKNNVTIQSTLKDYETSKETKVYRNTSDGGGEPAVLKVLKVDQDNKAIENIAFELVSKDNENYKGTARTNSSGYVEFIGLLQGTYLLTEKSSTYYDPIKPVQFKVDNSNYKALNLLLASNNSDRTDIKYNKMSFLDTNLVAQTTDVNVITNTFLTGQFQITKKDSDTKALLTGAEFSVLNESGSVLQGDAGTLVIGADGTGKSSRLPLGKYFLQETKAPNGYELSDVKLPITLDSSTTIAMYDVFNKAKAAIRIYKYDPDTTFTGNSLLAGTRFNLYNANNDTNILETIIIGNDGYGLSQKWVYGDYNLVEVYAPNNYVFSNDKIPVTISKEALNNGTVVNIPIANTLGGYIKIKKYDPNNTFNGNGVSPLKGTTFKIFRNGDDKTELGTIVIGDNGYGMSKDKLAYGKYNLIEVSAPTGYYYSNAKIPVEINKNTLAGVDFVQISVANTLTRPEVTPGTPQNPSTTGPNNPNNPSTTGPSNPRTTSPSYPVYPPSYPDNPSTTNPSTTNPSTTKPNNNGVTTTPTSTTIIINPLPTKTYLTGIDDLIPGGNVTPNGNTKTPTNTTKTPTNTTKAPTVTTTASVATKTAPNSEILVPDSPLGGPNAPKITDNLDEKVPLGEPNKPNKTGDLTEIEDGTAIGKPGVPTDDDKKNPKTNDSFKAYTLILVLILTSSLLCVRWFISKYGTKLYK